MHSRNQNIKEKSSINDLNQSANSGHVPDFVAKSPKWNLGYTQHQSTFRTPSYYHSLIHCTIKTKLITFSTTTCHYTLPLLSKLLSLIARSFLIPSTSKLVGFTVNWFISLISCSDVCWFQLSLLRIAISGSRPLPSILGLAASSFLLFEHNEKNSINS